jgi:hypothetical protein
MTTLAKSEGTDNANPSRGSNVSGPTSNEGCVHEGSVTNIKIVGGGGEDTRDAEGIFIQLLHKAVTVAEKATLERLDASTLCPIGTDEGQLGTICRDWTKMLDIDAKQEVTNETLSYIPMKVSAVCDEDVVLGYITSVEQQMARAKLPLDQRPPIVTEGPAIGRSAQIPVCGYVDPGAAHSVIRKDVVERAIR